VTDPRIHERRVQVARETGRRRRRWLIAAAGVATLGGAAIALVHSSVFGARHLEVTGQAHVPASTLVRVAGLEGAPPLVDLSTTVIEHRLDSLPWVKTASVSLSWPSTVRIALTERVAVAAVAIGGGEWAVVDPTGRVLEDDRSRSSGLPVIRLSRPVPHPGGDLTGAGTELAGVAAATPESMVSRIATITTSRQGIAVELTNRVVALFGNDSLLGDKFVALNTLLVRGDLQGVAEIDLRVPSAPALLP
jgi:cell division protein FtsQ